MKWSTVAKESARFILRASVIGGVLGLLLGMIISPMEGLVWGTVLGFASALMAMLGTARVAEAVLWEEAAQRAGESFYRQAWVE